MEILNELTHLPLIPLGKSPDQNDKRTCTYRRIYSYPCLGLQVLHNILQTRSKRTSVKQYPVIWKWESHFETKKLKDSRAVPKRPTFGVCELCITFYFGLCFYIPPGGGFKSLKGWEGFLAGKISTKIHQDVVSTPWIAPTIGGMKTEVNFFIYNYTLWCKWTI